MIRQVTLRRFKRFREVTFTLPDHVVFAGPNNTGKTTLLQAIAAWEFSFNRWRQLNNFRKSKGLYSWAYIAPQAFSAVPLRQFNLLWNEKNTDRSIVIEIQDTEGWSIAMELRHDSTEQIKVRPSADGEPAKLRQAKLTTVFVSPMTGLVTDEPLYARPEFLNAMLSQARPGEVLRNLLVQANGSEESWRFLEDSIRRLFNYELLPPDAAGAHIVAEYRMGTDGPRFDIACAGSGFQQVLMLLTLLSTRPSATLLLDAPAHHPPGCELRRIAVRRGEERLTADHRNPL